MLKKIRVQFIKFILHIIDHKCFNTLFVRSYKKLFSHISPKQMVIFDVGTHEGEFITLFRKLFPESQIHCFEPDPENFKKIAQKFSRLSSVYLNPFGIGNANESQKFYRNILSYTSSYKNVDLTSKWIKTKAKTLGVKPKELILSESLIPLRTLDSYAEEHAIKKIHILKIDAEGYELKCLEGCRNLLKQRAIESIQLEIHHDDMYKDHHSLQDLEDILSSYGYKIYKRKTHFLIQCEEVIFQA